MTDKKHFTTLDSLRGIAAIMVVILHSYWSHDLYFYNFFRNGYLFVDLFFILSGFVIIYNYYDKILFDKISISVSIWTLLESILLVSIIWFLGSKSEVNKLDFIAYFMNFIVLFLFMFSKGLVSKVIGAKSFVFLGKISFSIYMVHYLFSLVIKNFMKIYFKADFVIDNWGGYLEIDRSIGNCVLFFYLILVIVVANFTFIHIEQRFKHGFFKN